MRNNSSAIQLGINFPRLYLPPMAGRPYANSGVCVLRPDSYRWTRYRPYLGWRLIHLLELAERGPHAEL